MFGSTLLALCLLKVCLTTFYVTFTITAVQIPEATELDDVLFFQVRLFLDIFYSFFLLLVMLWDKVTK